MEAQSGFCCPVQASEAEGEAIHSQCSPSCCACRPGLMPSGAPGAMLGQGAAPGMVAKSQEEQLGVAEVLFQPARHRGHFCAPEALPAF